MSSTHGSRVLPRPRVSSRLFFSFLQLHPEGCFARAPSNDVGISSLDNVTVIRNPKHNISSPRFTSALSKDQRSFSAARAIALVPLKIPASIPAFDIVLPPSLFLHLLPLVYGRLANPPARTSSSYLSRNRDSPGFLEGGDVFIAPRKKRRCVWPLNEIGSTG